MVKGRFFPLALLCLCLVSCTATADLVRSTVPALAAKKSFTVEGTTIHYRAPAGYEALEGSDRIFAFYIGHVPKSPYDLHAFYKRSQPPAHTELYAQWPLVEVFGILTPTAAMPASMTLEEFQAFIPVYCQQLQAESGKEIMTFDPNLPLEETLGQLLVFEQTERRFTFGQLDLSPPKRTAISFMTSLNLVRDRVIVVRHVILPHDLDHVEYFVDMHERLLRALNLS